MNVSSQASLDITRAFDGRCRALLSAQYFTSKLLARFLWHIVFSNYRPTDMTWAGKLDRFMSQHLRV